MFTLSPIWCLLYPQRANYIVYSDIIIVISVSVKNNMKKLKKNIFVCANQ